MFAAGIVTPHVQTLKIVVPPSMQPDPQTERASAAPIRDSDQEGTSEAADTAK